MGAKMTPTAKKSGRTVFGVRIGCHAFSRCCRKALSAHCDQFRAHPLFNPCSSAGWRCLDLLGGRRDFCCVLSSSLSRLELLSISCIVCDMIAVIQQNSYQGAEDRNREGNPRSEVRTS